VLITGSSFEVRTINHDDLEEVLEVYRQCEDFLALGAESAASTTMVLKDIEISKHEGGFFCSIRNTHGKMIGIIGFVPGNFKEDPSKAFITLLMIALPFRNQGIGTEIVELVEKEVGKESRVKTILSSVQVNNHDAIRFWLKNGYQIVGGPELQPDNTTVFHLLKDRK
jgi:ribosomal protein S18 acetylase RimI-like enzyme